MISLAFLTTWCQSGASGCRTINHWQSRTHTPEQKISKIARNIEAFGFTKRILGPRSVCARLYVVRPHQVFGAETAFAETARFIKVSALIR